jgi:mannitol-specific phosphotransferase system IIBC component
MGTEILEIVFFVVFILMFSVLSIDNVKTRIQNKKLKRNLSQETIDRLIVMQKMQELMADLDNKNSNQNDGFLKFVSESRNAAFKYIEEVQAAINEFDKQVGPVVKYYKETGKVLERKPSELIRDLTQAYDKLMGSMPKEEKGSE